MILLLFSAAVEFVPPFAMETGIARAIVPVEVITPPVRPVPAVIEVTAVPLEAAVILPFESTVRLVRV
jgi:hypothetical protein